MRLLQVLQQLVDSQPAILENGAERALGHILASVDRHGGGTPVRMPQPVMAAVHPGNGEPGTLKRLHQPVAPGPPGQAASGDVEIERPCELGRDPVLFDHHTDSLTQIRDSHVRRSAVAVGATAGTQPRVRAPHAVLVLLDGVRDVHCGHGTNVPRSQRGAATTPAATAESPGSRPVRVRSLRISGTMTCMTTADPAAGLERLNALITADLWKAGRRPEPGCSGGLGNNAPCRAFGEGHPHPACRGRVPRCAPLLRSVMEYALGTIWLADAGEDAVNVLNRRLQGSHGKLLVDLGDIDLDTAFPPEAAQTFRDVLTAQLPPHPNERLSAFRHLLKEYGFEKMIPIYNVISGITHLSLEGARIYSSRTGQTRRRVPAETSHAIA
jgi:hypothetical protein